MNLPFLPHSHWEVKQKHKITRVNLTGPIHLSYFNKMYYVVILVADNVSLVANYVCSAGAKAANQQLHRHVNTFTYVLAKILLLITPFR